MRRFLHVGRFYIRVDQWVEIQLVMDFLLGRVSVSANGGAAVDLPIGLSASADKARFRPCYRGEGAGNLATMLLDGVSFAGNALVAGAADWHLYE